MLHVCFKAVHAECHFASVAVLGGQSFVMLDDAWNVMPLVDVAVFTSSRIQEVLFLSILNFFAALVV